MNCPKCGSETRVYDSRRTKGDNSMRRRRKCLRCGHRFTTREVMEVTTDTEEAVVFDVRS